MGLARMCRLLGSRPSASNLPVQSPKLQRFGLFAVKPLPTTSRHGFYWPTQASSTGRATTAHARLLSGAANVDMVALRLGAVAFIRRFASSLNENGIGPCCAQYQGTQPRVVKGKPVLDKDGNPVMDKVLLCTETSPR